MRRSIAITFAMLFLVSAAPALARPLDGGHYAWTDSGDACGYARESSGNGVFLIKDATPRTDGQFFYFQDNYAWRDVITNPANGKWAVVSGDGLFKEVRAVPQGDGVFTYHSIETGRPFQVADMNGRVVVRDRGLIDFEYVFDTLNDGAPGGVYYDQWLVRVSGPHPGFADTFDLCGVLDDLIG